MTNNTPPTNALQLTQEHLAASANLISGNITLFGVLTISWDVDLSVPQVTVTVTVNVPFLGQKTLGSATLNAQSPSVQIGGSLGPVTAEVDLDFNVSSLMLSYNVQATVFGSGYTKQGSIQL
jgi:hypothetical protein